MKKEEDFEEVKEELDCITLGIYTIKFDNYELLFDDECSTSYLYDSKEKKNKKVKVTSKLRTYIIDVSK